MLPNGGRFTAFAARSAASRTNRVGLTFAALAADPTAIYLFPPNNKC